MFVNIKNYSFNCLFCIPTFSCDMSDPIRHQWRRWSVIRLRDRVMSLESDVNIRWCWTCLTRPKVLANLGRNCYCTHFYFFLSNIFGKRFTYVKTSSDITCFPWFIFFLCERRFHVIKSHRKFWCMKII
jgi:hypothetical protein